MGELFEKVSLLHRSPGPSQERGKMTPHFVRPHVAVERQPIGSSQQRGIPKLCVKTSDRAGNGGKFGQGEANHLVAAGSATNFFDEEEPICAPMSRCPGVHLRRVLATERS
ncbi:MAG: hypothetical protein ABR82_01295 [Verrucomicrobia subdivision 6 bacterium BACL9 MAG-120507-bin52]|uniref:Uncharacterized protein n=1 Tax=Verrucomicrobia subdivision 6 bacterium BACL9 MAG-120507-bin52 TaxID=1655590 RepID=A0A0R2RKT8_9BACT|nr:MAG: hypothetical protein ABR82_01295 [Verrucomicrobia subdivision 6 bacterium BACL9 MAG-120507-bin52]